MLHKQGDAGLGLAVQRDVNGIEARVFELELLEIHDEIARAEVHIFGQGNIDGNGWEIGHDRASIRVHEIEAQVALAFLAVEEGHAQSDRALWVNRWKLLRVDGVESAQQIQFAVVIGRRVAENCHLDVHCVYPQTLLTGIA